MKCMQIAPGVRLRLLATRKFRTNTICVLVRRPLARDEVTLNALVSMVLEMGCAKYDTAAKLAAQTERMYGAIFSCGIVKKGEEHIFQFFLEYLPRNTPLGGITDREAFEFLREVMLRPLVADGGFDPDIVAGEKRVLSAQIAAAKNHKAEYSRNRMLEEMCSGEPFAVSGIGYAEDVDGITPAAAYAHYMRVLAQSPIDIMLVGDSAENTVEDICREVFGNMPRDNVRTPPMSGTVCTRALRKNVHEHADTHQGNLAMGYRGDIPQTGGTAYALMMFNELFGGYGSSRLFTVVRERESMAYSVSSTLYRLKSIIAVHAGVDTANFGKAAKLVQHQFADLTEGGAAAAELENALKSLLKKYESIKDYPGQLLEFYTMQMLQGEQDSPDEVSNKLRAVTAQDIRRAASALGLDTIYTLGNDAEEGG